MTRIRTLTLVPTLLVLLLACEESSGMRLMHYTPAGFNRTVEKELQWKAYAARGEVLGSGERAQLAARGGKTSNPGRIIVEPGVGFWDISLTDPLCSKKYVKSKLGRPDREKKRGLDYKGRYQMDFFFSKDEKRLTEIRLNRGFKGKLASDISMSSSASDVFNTYGEPSATVQTDNLQNTYPGDRLLIKKGPIGKIYYQDEGLLFWFNGNRISQIVTFEKPVAAVSEEDTSFIVVEEGIGFDGIVVGSPDVGMDFIKSILGEPDEVSDQYIGYDKRYGVEFVLVSERGWLWEIHLNKGFGGALTSGISLSSTKDEVFATYGEPLAENEVDDLRGKSGDRILYTRLGIGRMVYAENGLLFWFDGQKINQIVVFKPRSAGGQEGGTQDGADRLAEGQADNSQDWADWILDILFAIF